MWQLNLPEYNFRIKKQNEKYSIFDSHRKRYVKLTPEEWVRQNFIRFLIEAKGYPASFIVIEKEISYNGLKKRCDAVLYNAEANPVMIIEFKGPSISIGQDTFDQVAVYNSRLNVKFLIVSNGIEHYCCRVNKESAKYNFFAEIPDYEQLLK